MDDQTRKEARVEFERQARKEHQGDYCRQCGDWMYPEDRCPEDNDICRGCGDKVEEAR